MEGSTADSELLVLTWICIKHQTQDIRYYSGSSTSDRYACMYACDIHIVSFWGCFLE